MTTSNEYLDSSAQTRTADPAAQPEEAQATAAGIVAENAALEEAFEAAEAQAEAITGQASQMAEATGEVLAELQEQKEAAEQA